MNQNEKRRPGLTTALSGLFFKKDRAIENYPKPFRALEDAFDLIEQSSTGAALLPDFLSRYKRGEIRIYSLEEIQLRREKFTGIQGQIRGGFFFLRPYKVIVVDLKQPLGLVAPLLFHEMVHALDEEYFRLHGLAEELQRLILQATHLEEKRALERRFKIVEDTRIFRTEQKAYRAQKRFVEELSEKIPGYSDFILAHEESGYRLLNIYSDHEILTKYDLKHGPLVAAK